MSPLFLDVVAWLGFTALGVLVVSWFLLKRRYAVPMPVVCQSTASRATVRVRPENGLADPLSDRPRFQVTDCSNWPERSGCGEWCLTEIEAAAAGHLGRTPLDAWLDTQQCTRCSAEIDSSRWWERRPALVAPNGQLIELQGVPIDRLDQTLEESEPLCRRCTVPYIATRANDGSDHWATWR